MADNKAKEQVTETVIKRSWWKKKRWWIVLLTLTFALVFYADRKIANHLNNYVLSINANFEEEYKTFDLTKISGGKLYNCKFRKLYGFYEYRTCFHKFITNSNRHLYEYEYWEPRPMFCLLGRETYFREPYSKRRLIWIDKNWKVEWKSERSGKLNVRSN